MGSTLIVDNIQGATTAANVKMPAGHVVQVVQHEDTTVYTNATTSAAQGPQTNTFTLKNSSNRVLVTVNCCTRVTRNTASGIRLAIYRGSVASGTRITAGGEPQVYTQDSGTEQYAIVTMQYLDTPNAASTTYSLGFWKHPSSTTSQIKGDFVTTIITMQEVSV